ncbi:hypothetical protein DRN97_10940 [Methanosarcinales archaeon]|nr:MAG: hypothetical protein DRN97_10940 [Methanosarcinales archaeon]
MRDKKMVLLEIVVVLCLLFLEVLPVIAAEQEMQKVSASEIKASEDFVLGIYGNARRRYHRHARCDIHKVSDIW